MEYHTIRAYSWVPFHNLEHAYFCDIKEYDPIPFS